MGIGFYIASSLDNAEAVKRLNRALTLAGHYCTYDWTTHGPVFKADASVEENAKALKTTAAAELQGVTAAHAVIVLMPGGRGTHIEIGAALASYRPILICGAGAIDRWPCFYGHDLVQHIEDSSEIERTLAVMSWVKGIAEKQHG
jgi:hypothetical protein